MSECKSKRSQYPKLMVRGSSLLPTSFWSYLTVKNKKDENKAREQGFVKSNV